MEKKKEKKIIEDWIMKNGAAQFDTKNRDVILNDGGLFSIEKETKIKPKTKIIFSKEPEIRMLNGRKLKVFPVSFKKTKKNGKQVKEKVDYYSAHLWFEEVDETIEYLRRVRKLLNKLGYKTSYEKK